MNGTRRSAAIVASRSAVISACFSSSIAHGPPISASGAPPPIVIGPTRTTSVAGDVIASRARLGRRTASPRIPMLQSGAHESREERVRLPGTRPELRVELTGDEVRMLGKLDDLDERLLRPEGGNGKA